MVDFSGLADKAKGLIGEHSEQIKDGVEKVGGFAGKRFGDDKVDPIEDKIEALVDKLAGEHNQPAAPVVPVTPVPPATPAV